jgi:formylmethanofuran dehydrogenase subunit C
MHTRRGDAGDHHGIYVDEGHIYLDGNVHKHNELNILELEVPAGTFKSHVVIAKQEA